MDDKNDLFSRIESFIIFSDLLAKKEKLNLKTVIHLTEWEDKHFHLITLKSTIPIRLKV